jgi:hypothetical protein
LIPEPLDGVGPKGFMGAVLALARLRLLFGAEAGVVVERVCRSRFVSSSFVRRGFAAGGGLAQDFPIVIGDFGVKGLVAALRGSGAAPFWLAGRCAAQFTAKKTVTTRIASLLLISRSPLLHLTNRGINRYVSTYRLDHDFASRRSLFFALNFDARNFQ